MKIVTFKYENAYNGKIDTYKKEIDLELQAGNNQAGEEIQRINMLMSLSLAYIDFCFKLGYTPDDALSSIAKCVLSIVTDDDEEEEDMFEDKMPETDFTSNSLDYEEFLEEFENQEEFKQKVYQAYQLYMSNWHT